MVTRAVARKLMIKTIVNAPYFAGNDIEHPNHILVNDEKIIRVNTIGFLKSKYENPEANYCSITLQDDDGSELKAKFFEGIDLSDFNEGDLVKVIGKVRKQAEDIYILGEIVKKVPKNYFEIRKNELFSSETSFKNKDKSKTRVEEQDTQKSSEDAIVQDLGEIEE